MLKKTAFVATAAAGLMMLGSPAFATTGGDDGHGDGSGQVGLVNVNDVLNDNNVGVCDNKVNVLGVQATDALNGLGIPLLSPGGATGAESNAPDICAVQGD